MRQLIQSLKNINYRLYVALLLLGLCPAIYTSVRVFLIGQLPGEYSFSIAGQLSWINLIYEILNESIILPLYYFICKVKEDKQSLTNRVRTGLMITLCLYLLISAVINIFAEHLLCLMATNKEIIDASAQYIRIESVANIFSVLSQFSLVVLVSMNRSKYIYAFTLGRLVICILTDMCLVSSLPISLKLGINGVGYSNIVVNILLLAISTLLLAKEKISLFSRDRLDFGWTKELIKVGGISGLESLVRNAAYMIMVARMVNVVGEQGTYWVANNFIWSWLLLPVLQLGELIKRETAENKDNFKKNAPGYFALTMIISLLWIASMPLWKPFMSYVLGLQNSDKIFELVRILIGFYMFYAIQNVFDSTFYGLGKTKYMLFEAVITNSLYYGAAFVLYMIGVWHPSLMGIALLFGIGNIFDGVVSFFAYLFLLNKEKHGYHAPKTS